MRDRPARCSPLDAIGEGALMIAKVLLVPGLWNSGPENWQSYWERERGDCLRVVQANWETPSREDWVVTLERAVAAAPRPVVLAAHSLGCALVAHWAESPRASVGNVRGALLVAPSDVAAPSYPRAASGFDPMPRRPLPFPALVVASSGDPYVTLQRARQFAQDWGARLFEAGPLGHINADSNLGSWPRGQALLDGLFGEGGQSSGPPR